MSIADRYMQQHKASICIKAHNVCDDDDNDDDDDGDGDLSVKTRTNSQGGQAVERCQRQIPAALTCR